MGKLKSVKNNFSQNKRNKHFQIYAVNCEGLQGDPTIVMSPLLALGRLTSTFPFPHFSGLPQFNSTFHFRKLVLLTSALQHLRFLGIPAVEEQGRV